VETCHRQWAGEEPDSDEYLALKVWIASKEIPGWGL
jgi:hypothetical protein